MNHLNQRKSPSATLVSKEIETTFRSSFFPKSRKVPEVADLSISCGWGMSDYQTPQKDGEVDKSLDEEDDLNDREKVAPTSRLF